MLIRSIKNMSYDMKFEKINRKITWENIMRIKSAEN